MAQNSRANFSKVFFKKFFSSASLTTQLNLQIWEISNSICFIHKNNWNRIRSLTFLIIPRNAKIDSNKKIFLAFNKNSINFQLKSHFSLIFSSTNQSSKFLASWFSSTFIFYVNFSVIFTANASNTSALMFCRRQRLAIDWNVVTNNRCVSSSCANHENEVEIETLKKMRRIKKIFFQAQKSFSLFPSNVTKKENFCWERKHVADLMINNILRQ